MRRRGRVKGVEKEEEVLRGLRGKMRVGEEV